MRKFFLGPQNAIQYITRVDKSSVIRLLRLSGAKIGKNCDIETGLIFHNCDSLINLTVGDNCHIGKSCFFDLRDKINIEHNCVISMGCYFITHIDMNNSQLRQYYPAEHNPISVLNNTYIGAKATILMGVILENNSFVAANALVVSSVKTNTLVGGIPARIIKNLRKL